MAGNANSGSKREKLVREALMLAAKRVHEGDPEGRIKLNVAAARIMELAVEGDIQAFKEVADRLDGKSPQSLDVTTRHEQSVSELDEAELDRRIRELRIASGKAPKAEKPQVSH
jgi:hypothetical protein